MKTQSITAEEIQEVVKISHSESYQIVRGLNKKLKAMEYITIAGRYPIQYFKQKFYDLGIGDEKECHQNKKK